METSRSHPFANVVNAAFTIAQQTGTQGKGALCQQSHHARALKQEAIDVQFPHSRACARP